MQAAGYGSASSSLQTQVAIIKSDTVLLTVARDLDLPNNAAFTGYYGPNRHLSLDDLNVRQGTLNGMNADISVGVVPKTDLVQISCQTLDPKLSSDIVNRLIREFIQRDLQSSYEATQRVSDFLSLQLRDLKQEVETQQEQLIDLQKRIGVLGFDPQHNQIQSTLDDLTRAVSAAQIARIQQQARYKTLSTMNPDALDGTIGAQAAGGLSTSLSGLRATREQLLARYAELSATLGRITRRSRPSPPRSTRSTSRSATSRNACSTRHIRPTLPPVITSSRPAARSRPRRLRPISCATISLSTRFASATLNPTARSTRASRSASAPPASRLGSSRPRSTSSTTPFRRSLPHCSPAPA